MRTQRGGLCAAVLMSALVLGACARHHSESTEPVVDDAGPAPAADGGIDAGKPPKPPKPIDENAHLGAKAMVDLEPVSSDASAPVYGRATFSETADGVDLEVQFRGCALINSAYPQVILAGSDCSDAAMLGAHWAHGEGIPAAMCTGTTGQGRTFYTRSKTDDNAWTIGKPDSTNLLGHVLVVYDPDTLQPAACGVIGRADDIATPATMTTTMTTPPSLAARAVVAGMCLSQMIVRDNQNACPDPTQLTQCASAHCELDACLATCASFTACVDHNITPDADACGGMWKCSLDEACATCQGNITQCTFGFCSDVVACASPVSPDGPCAKLEACCAMQGDDSAQSCLDTVHLIEKLSGDPSCYGAMHDWDTTAHLKVPCMFE
jgi:hypothetical protein